MGEHDGVVLQKTTGRLGMRRIKYVHGGFTASEISLGCMRMGGLTVAEADTVIQTALDEGIDFFDHADIYGGGSAEEKFTAALSAHPGIREKIILQSKCGIRNGLYDFSKEHILSSAEGILKRLKTDYLDILLLHRPDTLMEPEEVAEAFSILHNSGKVRHFGVSNQNPMQMELLSGYLNQKIIANQLQLSITNTGMIDAGLNVNMQNNATINRDGGVLEYCRLKNITIQTWSPFQHGFFSGAFLGSDKFPELNAKIDEMSKKYDVPNTAIAIAWILRHPAKMQPIIGTMNPQRIKDSCKASTIELSRMDWYDIYRSAGNSLP